MTPTCPFLCQCSDKFSQNGLSSHTSSRTDRQTVHTFETGTLHLAGVARSLLEEMSTRFPVCVLRSRVKSLSHPGPKAKGQLGVQSATVLCVRGSSWSGECVVRAVQSCVTEAGREFGPGFGSTPARKRSASIRFTTVKRAMTPPLRRMRSLSEANFAFLWRILIKTNAKEPTECQ